MLVNAVDAEWPCDSTVYEMSVILPVAKEGVESGAEAAKVRCCGELIVFVVRCMGVRNVRSGFVA